MGKSKHPGCGCRMCRRGSPYKAFTLKAVNRRIRKAHKQLLADVVAGRVSDIDPVIVSVPYTD